MFLANLARPRNCWTNMDFARATLSAKRGKYWLANEFRQMKAVVKYAPGVGNVEIRDMPDPQPNENQVRIEIAACGICGTDLHVYNDTFRNFPPVILGHEFAGAVV